LKYNKANIRLVEILCIYGYSFTTYIPVAVDFSYFSRKKDEN
jgi:hypothetical protein